MQPRAPSLQARSAAASKGNLFGKGPISGPQGQRPLSEADLGARISVLFRIHDDPEHPFSEVVGVLQRIDPETASGQEVFCVLRRNGDLVSVPSSDVVKFKLLDGALLRET